jgi:signal transduction histidine kinase
MLRSLWFRLVGALVAVVVVTLLVVLVATTVIIRREYSQFLTASARSIENVLPDGVLEVTVPRQAGSTRLLDRLDWQTPAVVEQRIDLGQILSAADNAGLQFVDSVQQSASIAIGIAGLVAVILGTWLFRHITRPMGELRLAAQKLAEGNLTVRIPVRKPDEVGRVATAFNHMAGQMEQQEGLRQQMVADVAHELRTPLSVMQGNLEAMMDGLITPDETELAELHDEVLRLSRLVEDLRLLSLADAGELALEREKVDAGELVETVVRRLTPLAKSEGVALSGEIGLAPMIIPGDRGKLQQALVNLVDNGIRYTPPGGSVRVRAQRQNGTVHLVVTDQGPGIAPADLPYVFERFWRGSKSRSRDEGGSGLGLSIVKQIATLHGGQVSVALPPGGGSQFSLVLPANPME